MARRRGRRGEGSVYYSATDKRWIAKWSLGVVDGKRQTRRVKCRTELEANRELERMRRAFSAGGDPASGTLGQYLAKWLPEHRGIRDSTRSSYETHIRLYIDPLLGGILLAKLGPSDVRRLVTDLERKGKSPGYIHLVIRTLSVALNTAKHDRIIPDNATEGVRLPRLERKPVRALTQDEAEAIVDAVRETWLSRPVRVLLGSGIRRGELVGLDQRDVHPGFVHVRVSKTYIRAVPISTDAEAALRESIKAGPREGDDEPVFWGHRQKYERMRGDALSHALPRVLEAAGLGHLAPHALRHGAATLMLTAGNPMRVIAEQLGHRNPALTARIYAHVVPEAQRTAVDALERRQGPR